MLAGPQIVTILAELGITHVVWIPDSVIGQWESALDSSSALKLLRVSREGEAWGLAAGLYLGGQRPLVVMQNTGFFESCDAMRNVLFDLKLPLFAVVGYRGYLVPGSTDTARHFTEPVLNAWGMDWVLIDAAEKIHLLADHYQACQMAGRPGIVVVAEGRG